MANITLPYGRENKTVCIPDERLRGLSNVPTGGGSDSGSGGDSGDGGLDENPLG